jgi:hypothetical protein
LDRKVENFRRLKTLRCLDKSNIMFDMILKLIYDKIYLKSIFPNLTEMSEFFPIRKPQDPCKKCRKITEFKNASSGFVKLNFNAVLLVVCDVLIC